jgi:hypothetical protein
MLVAGAANTSIENGVRNNWVSCRVAETITLDKALLSCVAASWAMPAAKHQVQSVTKNNFIFISAHLKN